MLFGKLVFDGLAMGLIFVILATGFVIITSVNKILFMAYAQFYTIGAYITWYAINSFELPYGLALIVGVLASGLLGVLGYKLIYQRLQRLEGGFLTTLIASMGLLMLLSQGCLLIFGTNPRSIPTVFPGTFSLLGINISVAKLVTIGIGVALTLFLFWVFEKTAIGRSMRAVVYLPEAASLQGINTTTIYMLALGIGTALAGFAGGILAPTYGISPSMGNNILWTVILMTMLGGMDSMVGAVIGGVVIGQILSFGQYYIGSTVQICLFVFIGVVLYFRPKGLMGRGIDIGV